jgi:phosphoserine aminotransferase
MKERIYNFNPGPAALPLEVLMEIKEEFLNFKGSGMSIVEISHRSSLFNEVLQEAVTRTKRLLKLGENFHVIFLQGGASLQFAMVPMNLIPDGGFADYVNTGTWSQKAIKEAKILGKEINVIASSEDRNFCYIPKEIPYHKDAAYVHITSNNTIKGTQWAKFPDTGDVPLVSDMSSDIMSRRFDPSPFGLIYAGAQKNLGAAGATLVIIRGDMLERVPKNLPTMLKYTTHVEENSLFNTPSCFAIYTIQLTLRWLEEKIGGIEKIEAINNEKARLLYDFLDSHYPFYRPTADRDSRSKMNVTFRLLNEELEDRFVKEAQKEGLGGLKGHRSVGGCRASIYNAVGLDAVNALIDFMEEFERKNG